MHRPRQLLKKLRQPGARSLVGTPIEIWFQDEARVGQQGTHAHIWARLAKGSVRRSRMEGQGEGPIGARPLMVRDNRHDSAYIFGAICPQRGVGAAMITPAANTEMMNLHLAEISTQVAANAIAVLTCDGAGWHQPGRALVVPNNIVLLRLPPYSPELNPMENVSDYLRQNKLCALVWDSYDEIVEACKTAWNWIIADPARIASIGTREWASVSL
jgi:DDE superfamily endonuclease